MTSNSRKFESAMRRPDSYGDGGGKQSKSNRSVGRSVDSRREKSFHKKADVSLIGVVVRTRILTKGDTEYTSRCASTKLCLGYI